MKLVTITGDAMSVIRSAATNSFKETRTKIGPNEWSVPLQDSTIERLKTVALPGETLSDTILRVVATSGRCLN